MKLILTSMVALAMAGAPLMARQEPQDDKDKPKKEEPKKPEPKAKPDSKPKQEAQPKPDEKQQHKTDRERQKPDEKQPREETRPAPQRQSTQQAPGREQARGEGRGPRIPEERFRTSFGREHHFHVRRDQRFQYGGYWFEVAQPWPVAWVFDDDCYVEEDGDTYYLVDALHPDVRVVVIVVEG